MKLILDHIKVINVSINVQLLLPKNTFINKNIFYLDVRMQIFNYPLYCIWGTLVIMQIFNIRFSAELHILGTGESKEHKIIMVSQCSLVSMLVGMIVSILVSNVSKFVSLWRRYLLNKLT